MSKVTSALGRPIQGVSQQPAKVRREGQCSLQENMNPSVVEGLRKRPGTRSVYRMMIENVPDTTKVHHYRRGDSEEYFVAIRPNALPQVFDTDSNPLLVVDNTADSSYLLNSNPSKNFELVTIADYTFIVNKTKLAKPRAEKSAALVNEALIYVQFATYGKYYQVVIDGVIAGQFQAPSGELPEHVFEVDTTKVATKLIEGGVSTEFEDSFVVELYNGDESRVVATLPSQSASHAGAANPPDQIINTATNTLFIYNRNYVEPAGEPREYTTPVPGTSLTIGYTVNAAGIGNLPGFLVTQKGNVIHLRKQDGSDFTVETIDGADGADLISIKGLLTDLGKLPPYAPNGFTVKIQPAGKSDEFGYWLQAVEREGNTVKWAEMVAPDTRLGMDLTTLPYTLVRTGFNPIHGKAEFSLQEGEWADRDVGDERSNPYPAFIDEQAPVAIGAIGVFQNRLFVTAGESVSMSRSGDFFNMFRQTTQTVTDDDPVGGYADSNQINTLSSAVILDQDLVMFSSSGQFKVDGRSVITNENFSIPQTNAFETIPTAKPAVSGESIFFAFTNGKFTGVREYFTDSLTDTKRARPITEHVDKYISGKATHLNSSPDVNMLLVLSDDTPNVVYVYNWLWQAEEKVQSAWHKWVFPEGTKVFSTHFSNDKLYIVIRRFGDLWVEYIDLNDNDDVDLGFEVRLDRLRRTPLLYTGADSYVVASDLFPDENIEDLEFLCGAGCYPEYIGMPLNMERFGSALRSYDKVTSGNAEILIGRKYKSRYVPSQPLVRDYRDRVIGIDKLTTTRFYVNYESLGLVDSIITGKFGEPQVTQYTGRILGEVNNIVGFAAPQAGQFVVPVLRKADDITWELATDDYVPFDIRDIEWSGQFNQRGRRI